MLVSTANEPTLVRLKVGYSPSPEERALPQ
jgi:hypothetical protein